MTTAYTPLDEHAIRSDLPHHVNQAIEFYVLTSVDSTSRFLKNQALNSDLTVCVAETQTHGRGRFSRPWHSPLGEHVYCSVAWRFDGALSKLSALGLIVSLAVHSALQQADVAIKWPNDLIWQDKKLAGILIEIANEADGITDVIIGIGLNVNAVPNKNTPINQPWCSLRDITQQETDRNPLLARLIVQLDSYLRGFSERGFEAYQTEWQTHDHLFGRCITVSTPQGVRTGRAQGINNRGYLQLIDEHGVTHALSSGDTSLAQKSF
ncbi:MAG: biotin--[acetyl-CoA-carboxylase] ligase [Legionellaceae bacterium]|nr:biotin--[acetyl-CoA-carboxylase] ligase [Legionellaceae bacterium]